MNIGRHPKRMAIIVIILLLIIVGIYIAFNIAPQSSTVEVVPCLTTGDEAQDCIRFPTVRGANLNAEARNLPDDFARVYNLVIIYFQREQTEHTLEWLATAEALQTQYEDFAFYNVPVLPSSIAPPIRLVINAGITAAIPDEMLREISIVMYLDDVDAFANALAITSQDELAILLLNDEGEVIWRESGEFTAAKGEALTDEMARRFG